MSFQNEFYSSFEQVAIDTIFFGSCLNIGTYCEIQQEKFDGNVKEFVENHLRILSLAENLNSLYKPIVFAQLLTTNILFCMIGYQVVMAKSLYGFLFVAPFGLAALNQLFMYCLGGQIIHDKMESIAKDFYEADKNLVIVIRKASKGFQIKAFVYQANLATFTAILGSAQGLITILKSFS